MCCAVVVLSRDVLCCCREALSAVCAKRGVELSSVSVFLDSYKTPLPVLTTETSWLGGKHLLVKGQ